MGYDGYFMRRALHIAARPLRTAPNPRVGAVVVRKGRILAEATHEGAGTPHAEASALSGIDAAGATLYVTLEPCVHEGRTPPCVPVIVSSGVERVVIALEDPDERVSGRGIDALRAAAIEVTVGVLADEARALNRAYLHHRATGRPFVTLKLALSIDGRLGAPDRKARWITGPRTRELVHRRRAEVDAILVGAGSVLADDPQLTAREVGATIQPTRVLVDASGRIPPTAAAFGAGEVLVATTDRAPHERQTEWKEAGAEALVLPATGSGVDLDALFDELGRRGFTEIYCEGGAELATSLLKDNLVDRLEIHHGPVLLGRGGPEIGDLGVTSMDDASRWKTTKVHQVGDDVVTVWEKD
ncbi:MAG TPA: bifunctional diaminohydroxyphosphoribosylaminopyrimidine deaminase/5-amino-6-(5-phosphoribosylamino)uracil reductase RibD [Actinomycetota bacterium]|nr:bifunctional diaminohydroxyphosphoribosylaminopyrimidine deaminase/5-amino-6-(5-phosphoribosylamino)uracil reductase RibD [Actinomycetota bacterium]